MNYIDEIFLRADIQQVRDFLLNGVSSKTDPRSYKERMESAQKKVMARLREAYPDMAAYEEMTGLLFDYVDAIEAVYMEIGLQSGAILAAQVYQNLKTALAAE
ncbi:MAG: hypothetical protein ACLSAP_02950 [Oscillospiraceae bacterium]